MHVFQCNGCDKAPCTYFTLDPDVDGDDLVCIRRTLNYLPVWRELKEAE